MIRQISDELLSESIQSNLSESKLPNSTLYYNIAEKLFNRLLTNNHTLITNYCSKVQKSLNTNAGIGLNPIKQSLNQSKITGLVVKSSNYPTFKQAKWLFGEPIINFSQSIVDDSIKKNIEFQYKAGMMPTIKRIVVGGCCDWCSQLAGIFEYGENVPKDVWRRHRYCRCMNLYNPGDSSGKSQNVWDKKYYESESEATKNAIIETQEKDQKEKLIRKYLKKPNAIISIPPKKNWH